jgi:hypothetical protein
MSKENVVSIDQNYSDKLADRGLWNPTLIAEITYVTQARIFKKITLQNDGLHFLEWASVTNRAEVLIEIRDGVSKMLINTDRFRTQRDELALSGIAAKYGLQYGEFEDVN